jgi:hypothetical protein
MSDLLGSIYEDLQGKTPEDQGNITSQSHIDRLKAVNEILLEACRDAWDYVNGVENFNDDAKELMNTLDDAIEEATGQGPGRAPEDVEEALKGKSEEDKEVTAQKKLEPFVCPHCHKKIDEVLIRYQSAEERGFLEGNKITQTEDLETGDLDRFECPECNEDLGNAVEFEF